MSFRRPTRPGVYDDALAGDKVTIAIWKTEAMHKAKIQDWDLYDTAEEESCRFIIDTVDNVWIAELKKKVTKYAEVKPIDMIRHLCKTALGAHKVDILELQD